MKRGPEDGAAVISGGSEQYAPRTGPSRRQVGSPRTPRRWRDLHIPTVYYVVFAFLITAGTCLVFHELATNRFGDRAFGRGSRMDTALIWLQTLLPAVMFALWIVAMNPRFVVAREVGKDLIRINVLSRFRSAQRGRRLAGRTRKTLQAAQWAVAGLQDRLNAVGLAQLYDDGGARNGCSARVGTVTTGVPAPVQITGVPEGVGHLPAVISSPAGQRVALVIARYRALPGTPPSSAIPASWKKFDEACRRVDEPQPSIPMSRT